MVYGVSMKNSGKKQQNSNLIEEKAASGQQELFITETQENLHLPAEPALSTHSRIRMIFPDTRQTLWHGQ